VAAAVARPGPLRPRRDAAAVAREAARIWARSARAAVGRRGRFRVALSGGKTPQALFRLLAERHRQDLPWEKTEVFWVDERHVPHDHAQSNYGLARAALLDRVPIPPANIHPMPTGSADPGRDAAAYELLLRRAFPGLRWPRFDLVLLGLGEDGHTASLFPGDAAVRERERWARAARSPAGVRDRVTLTAPALNHAVLKLFLVCGPAKAAALRALACGARPRPPAGLIVRPVILADREAASRLSGPARA